jgi:hypothetical protein
MPPQPDDDEPLYIIIVGDTEQNVNKVIRFFLNLFQAQKEIDKIFNADEQTRNQIRQE